MKAKTIGWYITVLILIGIILFCTGVLYLVFTSGSYAWRLEHTKDFVIPQQNL